jgi:flagellin
LAQVTTLLNRAVTLATESATGTVSSDQRTAIDAEFQAIKAEIDQIGSQTSFNGTSVFTASTTSIFLSDANSNSTIAVNVGVLSSSSVGSAATNLSADDLTTAANATTALSDINKAIAGVAASRGDLGATMNRLAAAVNVMQNQVQNLTAAQDTITAADIGTSVANLSKYQILQQTGISALAQANSSQQAVLKLLQ